MDTHFPWIAVVDDEEPVRRAVTRLLRSEDLAARAFGSGADFLAALRHSWPYCVVLDLNMPGMSGFGVLDWMRKDRSPHLPPAVFMTTELSEAALAQAKKAGAVGWVIKPCRGEQLVTVVSRILAKRGEADGR